MRRGLPVFLALGLIAAACSIQAPTVRLTAPTQDGNLVVSEAALGRAALGGTAGGGEFGGVSSSVSAAARCTGALGPGVSDGSIKIGSSVALSGPIRALTAPSIKSVKAYFNAVNNRGGVHGRKIDLVYMDDGWDAQKGVINIKKLVSRDRVLALTLSSSNGLDAATSYLEEQGVPAIGMSGSLSSQYTSPVVFPVGAPFVATARIALLDVAKRLRAKTVAIVWLDVQIGVEVFNALKRSIGRVAPGLSLVASRRVGASDPTMEPVWNDVQNQTRNWQQAHGQSVDGRPDYVLFALDPANAIKAMQAAQRLGFRPKIGWGGLPAMFHDLVLQSTDVAAKTNVYAMSSFIPATEEFAHVPGVREYLEGVRRYVAEGEETSPVVQLGWISAALMVRVLQDAGPCPTRQKVLAAADRITSLEVAGMTMPLTFRPPGRGGGHAANPWIMMLRAVPKGEAGCRREIGCWRWAKAPTANGWYTDPLPQD